MVGGAAVTNGEQCWHEIAAAASGQIVGEKGSAKQAITGGAAS